MNKKILSLVVALLALSGSCLFAAEKIMYKWTDGNGEVHYTERAPKGIEYTRIKTYVDSTSAVASKTTVKEPTKDDATEASKAYGSWRQENCTRAHENLDILRNSSRIGVDDGQGGKRLMSDEEKQEQIQQMEVQRDKYCEAAEQ